MKITIIEFLKGVIGSENLPQPERPTIAFFGRSNVGKSSILNCLAGKVVARANQKPGRTTEINYYLANENVYLADLPGYGYAKLPEALRKKISGYLSWFAADQRIDLRLAVLAVDAEIGVKTSDLETFRLLQEYNRPIVILANKADKGGRNAMAKSIQILKTTFAPVSVIRFSAKTGEGKNELLELMGQKLA
jgi:GTP-binding protein